MEKNAVSRIQWMLKFYLFIFTHSQADISLSWFNYFKMGCGYWTGISGWDRQCTY